ncbi:hypothetical protein TcWFU_008144 [Taenia crassiceps]|uniref:Uncharacterized protein n=1 Tax=Taenia crassiceps TaxID=6207 RepID=A0ABR4QBB7_9CEST
MLLHRYRYSYSPLFGTRISLLMKKKHLRKITLPRHLLPAPNVSTVFATLPNKKNNSGSGLRRCIGFRYLSSTHIDAYVSGNSFTRISERWVLRNAAS